MTPAAVELLKQGVALDVKAWLANVDADAQGRAILEQFLQRDDVLTHPVWKEHFQAWPPRGVVARLARRLNVSLSLRAGFYNFRTLADFKCEIKKIRRWYRSGRREVKPLRHRCRRIVRLRVQAQHVKIQRKKVHKHSIMTAKVELHYRRLLRPLRLQGLWRWRRAALAMLQAGLRMQSGTIPVERLWAIVQAMFPPQTRSVSEERFSFLSQLAFLRVIYLHFNGPSLPGWTRHDALLKESSDALLHIAMSFNQDDRRREDLLAALRKPFHSMADHTDATADLDARGRFFPDAHLANPDHQPTSTKKPKPRHFQTLRKKMQVFRRILKPEWSEALASGQKWVEVQRYQSTPTNQLSFAAPQKLLVFGPSGQRFGEVHGVAILAASAIRNQPLHQATVYLKTMAGHLHQPFLDYLHGAFAFDSVAIARVYDVRAEGWTWTALADKLQVEMPQQTQGFPGVGGESVSQALLQEVASVPVHDRPATAD